VDVRLNTEQRQLRDAAAKLADDLGPGSVADLDDERRRRRLEKTVDATGWRTLRSDGASGVEVAIVAEEFARGLVDVPFLGPVLADDLCHRLNVSTGATTIVAAGNAIEVCGAERALDLRDDTVVAATPGAAEAGVDLTRRTARPGATTERLGELAPGDATAWRALALVATGADLVGAARGAHSLACDYAKIREQYGKTIGSYQAVAHLLAEAATLIEGSISVVRHAAWAVDELDPGEALQAARVAKLYCARAARTVCETAIQVHGGIGNTWECLAHVYLRRALVDADLWRVTLKEVNSGLS